MLHLLGVKVEVLFNLYEISWCLLTLDYKFFDLVFIALIIYIA